MQKSSGVRKLTQLLSILGKRSAVWGTYEHLLERSSYTFCWVCMRVYVVQCMRVLSHIAQVKKWHVSCDLKTWKLLQLFCFCFSCRMRRDLCQVFCQGKRLFKVIVMTFAVYIYKSQVYKNFTLAKRRVLKNFMVFALKFGSNFL